MLVLHLLMLPLRVNMAMALIYPGWLKQKSISLRVIPIGTPLLASTAPTGQKTGIQHSELMKHSNGQSSIVTNTIKMSYSQN